MAKSFEEKLKTGEAKKISSGYGGSGFKFDETEMTAEQKAEAAAKRQYELESGIAVEEVGEASGKSTDPLAPMFTWTPSEPCSLSLLVKSLNLCPISPPCPLYRRRRSCRTSCRSCGDPSLASPCGPCPPHRPRPSSRPSPSRPSPSSRTGQHPPVHRRGPQGDAGRRHRARPAPRRPSPSRPSPRDSPQARRTQGQARGTGGHQQRTGRATRLHCRPWHGHGNSPTPADPGPSCQHRRGQEEGG